MSEIQAVQSNTNVEKYHEKITGNQNAQDNPAVSQTQNEPVAANFAADPAESRERFLATNLFDASAARRANLEHQLSIAADSTSNATTSIQTIVGAISASNVSAQSASSGDAVYDGVFVGSYTDIPGYPGEYTNTYSPTASPSQVPAIYPSGRNWTGKTIIHINGIQNTKDAQYGALQHTANTTGARVIGIHNATEGYRADIGQTLGDREWKGENKAVETLADTVYNEITAAPPRSVHLMAHSQGAAVTSYGLHKAKERLQNEGGYTEGQAEALLRELVKVETFGGAAYQYPDGPQYVHYINKSDIVTGDLGLLYDTRVRHAGADAVWKVFDHDTGWNDLPQANHSYANVYLNPQISGYVDFDTARQTFNRAPDSTAKPGK